MSEMPSDRIELINSIGLGDFINVFLWLVSLFAAVLTICSFFRDRPRLKSIDRYREIRESLDKMSFSDPDEEMLRSLYLESANLKIAEKNINRIGRISIWGIEMIAYAAVAVFAAWASYSGVLALYYYFVAGFSVDEGTAASPEWVFWGFAIEAFLFALAVIASVPWFTTRMNRFFRIDKTGQVERIPSFERPYPFVAWVIVVGLSLVSGMVLALATWKIIAAPRLGEGIEALCDVSSWFAYAFLIVAVILFAISVGIILFVPRWRWEKKVSCKIDGIGLKTNDGSLKFPEACRGLAEERGIDELANMLKWCPIDVKGRKVEIIRESFANRQWFDELEKIIKKLGDPSGLFAPSPDWEYEVEPNSDFIIREKRGKMVP